MRSKYNYALFHLSCTYHHQKLRKIQLALSHVCKQNLLKYYQFLASVFVGYFRFKNTFAISGFYLLVNTLCFKPPFVTLK